MCSNVGMCAQFLSETYVESGHYSLQINAL